ncbi:MAG: TrkA family potassium uptake protein [Lachnospiraceae bacterium]|nr:TrkA family potassium uptake protein [Lachnospiraceae bacterium]
MKSILVLGLGHFGKHIVNKLNELNCQIMAVDIDEDRVNEVLNLVDNAQIGDTTNVDFLKGLGIGNFDTCIVTITEDFQASLETTSLLKDLGAKHVVSRASSSIQQKFLLRNGADEVVYPEEQLAAWTCIRCTSENVFDYIDLGNNRAIYEVSVPAEWDQKTVAELRVRPKYGINILAIRDDGDLNVNVRPETVMRFGTTVLILGESDKISSYFRLNE